jgi:hypothetical protein
MPNPHWQRASWARRHPTKRWGGGQEVLRLSWQEQFDSGSCPHHINRPAYGKVLTEIKPSRKGRMGFSLQTALLV